MFFLENCGTDEGWDTDDLDTWMRKVVQDSLVYDQLCFEVTRDRRGRPNKFYAVDASTIRIANNDEFNRNRDKSKEVQGYYPSFVQLYQRKIHAEFYPWEICFGIRNPESNIFCNGYGVSELEDLVSIVTALLWGQDYNSRFFKQGSLHKGILKVKNTNMNDTVLQQFKQEWKAMTVGVQNAWRTPVVDGDVEWIDLTKSNRDMEFSKWTEFLIKLACAVYSIDPSEINFNLIGSSGQKVAYEGNNESRLKYSRDKGLFPILKFLQKRINKYLINPYNPKYELVFGGIDGVSPGEELELDIKAITNFKTINEVRRSRGMEDIEGGDIIMNGIFTNNNAMAAQNAAAAGQGEDEGAQEFDTPEASEEENPIAKAFTDYLTNIK